MQNIICVGCQKRIGHQRPGSGPGARRPVELAGIGQDDLAGDRARGAQEDPVTGPAPRHLPAGEPGQGGLGGLARPQDEPVAQRRRPPRRRRGSGRPPQR